MSMIVTIGRESTPTDIMKIKKNKKRKKMQKKKKKKKKERDHSESLSR